MTGKQRPAMPERARSRFGSRFGSGTEHGPVRGAFADLLDRRWRSGLGSLVTDMARRTGRVLRAIVRVVDHRLRSGLGIPHLQRRRATSGVGARLFRAVAGDRPNRPHAPDPSPKRQRAGPAPTGWCMSRPHATDPSPKRQRAGPRSRSTRRISSPPVTSSGCWPPRVARRSPDSRAAPSAPRTTRRAGRSRGAPRPCAPGPRACA